jgi:hypothetical protein
MEPKGFLIYPKKGIAHALNKYGHKNTPPITWTKIIQSMVLIKYPHEGIAFLLGFVKVMQYPFEFYKYVMEPKGFLIYPNRGIACTLNNYGHKKYPSNSLYQKNSIHGVYKIPS